jgi:hypothetical protein
MVESKYKQDFENWCKRERIKLVINSEIFFIDKRKTLMPMFQLGTNLFVHIVDKIEPKDDDTYAAFANSFNPIMVIPKDIIPDLIKHFSKKDLATYFKINI